MWVDVTVRELANPLIIEGVAQGALDLGVAIGGEEDAAVATRLLYEDRQMLAYRRDYRSPCCRRCRSPD